MDLVISQKAFSGIKQECLGHPQVETGGILVGTTNSRGVVVPFVIGSGPAARRTTARFEPDIEWQQKLLDEYFENYGLNYVGSFHTHFDGPFRPSSIDYQAAVYILSDPDWAVKQAVFPIILTETGHIVIYPYYMCQDNPEFQLMSMVLVPDHHPLIISVIEKEEPTCPES